MKEQYLEYIRQQLTVALADFSGTTKGQLQAWLENAQFVTGTFKRRRIRIKDETTGKWYTLDNPPVPGKQSLAKGASVALVLPVEFGTTSWRRAVLSLAEHQKAWVMWIYGENTRFEYQTEVTRWAWGEFRQINKRRIAAKTMGRLKTLIWLAAQDVKAEMAGHASYEYKFLAEMVGVTPKNWSENFTAHWRNMREVFHRLDREVLLQVSRVRVEQKERKFAKMD
ncbi:antiterminator [Salmonella enterica]